MKIIRQKSNQILSEWYMQTIDFTMTHLERTSDLINARLKYGDNNFNDVNIGELMDKYFGYFNKPIDTDSMQKRIDELTKDAQYNQSIVDGSLYKSLTEQKKNLKVDFDAAGNAIGENATKYYELEKQIQDITEKTNLHLNYTMMVESMYLILTKKIKKIINLKEFTMWTLFLK